MRVCKWVPEGLEFEVEVFTKKTEVQKEEILGFEAVKRVNGAVIARRGDGDKGRSLSPSTLLLCLWPKFYFFS